MTDLAATIDTYLASWNEADASRRSELIRTIWASDGRLVDPPLTGDGHDGISQMAAALQANYPGHSFRRVSAIDEHHGQFRFAWQLVGPDGGAVLSGMDVGELEPDGKLKRIAGFFGELPPVATNGAETKRGVDAI